MNAQNIIDVRRQSLIYEDTDNALHANRAVIHYETRLQALGELKIKEYRVLISKLHDAVRQLKRGSKPFLPDFVSTVFVNEEDETPFTLSQEGILKKITQLESRVEELRELLRLNHV